VTQTDLEQDFISRHIVDNLLDFEPVNEGYVKFGLKLNITI